MNVDDETLMAFADGELSDERTAAVAQAVAADPELQARLERFQEVRSRLAGLADVAPPPAQALMEAARRGVAARTTAGPRPWGWAVAAGVAGLSVALGLVLYGRGGEETASGALAAALDETPSGRVLERGDVIVAPLYTVVAADGRACRAFRTMRDGRAQEGAACRQDDGWRVLATADVPRPVTGFGQASAGEPAEVAAVLDALRPGDPLGVAEERARIARRWARE